MLHAKQGTTHFVFGNHHTVQTDQKRLTGSLWPTNNKSCQLEHLHQKSITTPTITVLCIIGHDTYFSQMLGSKQPACRKQNEGTFPTSPYVRVAPPRGPLQMSLLLNTKLELSSTSFYLAASDPPPLQKLIKQQAKQMKWCVFISTNDNCRAKATYLSPTLDWTATVESTEFVESCRNCRASR